MKNVESVYPLSPMQEGILYHTLSETGPGMYLNQTSWRITLPPGVPELRLDEFREAWRRAVEAHAVLRTSIVWEKVERPIQVVHRSARTPLRFFDLRDEEPERAQARLERDYGEMRERGFDLTRAPLFDVRLARLADAVYDFGFSFQHIVLDGWSVFLLLKEVMASYAALLSGGDPVPIGRRPFRDYILWLDQLDLGDAERFWRRELEGVTQPTPLVVERPGPVPAGERRMRLGRRRLSREDTAAIRSFARSGRLTLFTLLQAAWGLVLGRYSGHDRVVFGSVTLGRPTALDAADEMIGLFVNTVPVVVTPESDTATGEWLRGLQARQIEARQYEACPLRSIHEWSDVPNGAPLFETLALSSSYVAHSEAEGGAGFGSGDLPLDIEYVKSEQQTNYPLVIEVTGDDRLSLVSTFDDGRFDPETVDRMLGHVEAALSGFLHAERPRDVSVLLPAERREIVDGWSSAAPVAAPAPTVHEAFAAQVARRPDAVALVGGATALSYRATARRVTALARRLAAAGAGGESPVAVALARSPLVPIAWLAILEAGSAYLPVDPDLPPARLARIFESAAPSVVIVEAGAVAGWPEGLTDGIATVTVSPDGDDDTAREASVARVWPESLAHVIFTSGSTGTPKGCMNPHRGVLSRFRSLVERYGFGPDDRILQRMKIIFDPSVMEMAAPLLAGGCLVVARAGMSGEPAELGREIARQRIVGTTIVPSLLRVVLEHADPDDLRGLREVMVIGEVLDGELVTRFRSLLPEVRLDNHYGPTEATIEATRWQDDGSPVGRYAPPIGRPVPGSSAFLLDREMRPVPVGVPGEIFLGGPEIGRGYVHRPGETAARFVPDPFAEPSDPVRAPGGYLYRTGDLARWRPSGEIDFLGRIDHQVKIRGFRIELGEIEEVARAHPTVRDAVAIVRPAPDGSGSIVAYLVGEETMTDETPSDESEARRRALDTRFADLLPKYMRPSAQVWLDELPRLPNGKIDRKDLGRREPGLTAAEVIEPRDETERRLVEIWQNVLRRSPISVDGDFFDLGGHSLLAFRLMAKINHEMDVSLPMSELLTGAATPERLAARLRDRSKPLGWEPLVRLKDGDRKPFFCVHPVGGQVFGFRDLAEGMGPGQPFYGLQAPGLEDYDEADDLAVSIERMAAGYVAAIREALPDGPYFLGGMSFGVTVAFEMAQQLRRAGAPVGLVVLLDSPVPLGLEVVEAEDYSEVLAGACLEYAHQMGGEIDLQVSDLQGRDRDEQTAHVLRLLEERDLVSSELDVPTLRRFIDGHQARLTALTRYRPDPYPGELHLFRAVRRHDEILADVTGERRHLYRDPEMGWGPYARDGVVVHEFDAYHETLLRKPVVARVAARLQDLIDETSSFRLEVTSTLPTVGDLP